jgi:hypothetical protein
MYNPVIENSGPCINNIVKNNICEGRIQRYALKAVKKKRRG